MNELIDFIYESPSGFHCVKESKKLLDANGYYELYESETINVKKGGKYYITKGDSALIAFEVGKGSIVSDGLRIIGAHTDAPCFKIKPYSSMVVENYFLKLNVECYGGPILSTWFDRGLAVAGKVVLKGEKINKPIEKLINIKKSIMTIPNLAIHMNRTVNTGYEFNKQKDMLPLMTILNENLEKDNFLINIIADELGCEICEILDFELYLYDNQKGETIGVNDEFISSARLDDVWMVYSGLQALVNSSEVNATKVMICVDNEEVGSGTSTGASSVFVQNTLERIFLGLGFNREGFLQGLANSFAVSADLAHSLHPNYVDKHDPTNKPVMGNGPVIKYSANQKYSTNCVVAAIFKSICNELNVPCQTFVNRSDAGGGGTIGPILSQALGVPAVDVGAAILGMHSIREMGATKDIGYMVESFTGFYELV